mmetsp:Transcript_23089/g.54735  ORF Transcript_23089/g.54735 Transcript_23089/m.54735 type:complete len:81 (-) Transcript_23089:835-1077(-)|eukprot:1025024-Rhodomonas_salina.1
MELGHAHIMSWAEAQELWGRHFACSRNFQDADFHGDLDDFVEDLPSQEEVDKARTNFLAALEEVENHMQAREDGDLGSAE